MSISLPCRLGKYQLQQQVGAGATAAIYLALDTFSGQQLALKLIEPEVLDQAEFNEQRAEQFMNEAALAGQLDHPHIVPVKEASVSDECAYMVMEYLPKGDLTRYTQPDNLLAVEDSLQMMFKCCGALDYAFRYGIVHRDIKPANILIKQGSHVKIADFGSALFYKTQTATVVTTGTPFYMSPEQLRGKPLTYRSDMYSLGVVAYELLTGELPFMASSIQDLYQLIGEQQPPAPSLLRSEVPAQADQIVLKMMAADPEDRYDSWAEVMMAFAQISHFSRQQQFSDSDQFNMLRSSQALSAFSDPEIWELVLASDWQRYRADSVVLAEDEEGVSMFYIVSGNLSVIKQGHLLNTLRAGEFCGEMAYIMRGSLRQATVAAQTDAVIAEFPFAALESLSPGCELKLAKNLLLSMRDRLALAGDRIVRMHG